MRMLPVCVAILFIAISCDSTSNIDPELEAITIQTATVDGFTVELLSDADLATGYNKLYWKVTSGDDMIDLSSMSISPVMHMTSMSHACPYDQPTEMEDYAGVFSNMAVFIMPSGEMGYWEISFEIETQSGETISGTMEVDVESSWMLNSVKSTDETTTYFISWYAPNDPVTGNQELSFLVHKRATMMSFPAISDASLDVYPYMDMGGGEGHSTSFENPVAMGDGMYSGSINYSMSGTWTTDVTLYIEGDTLAVPTFEYSVRAQ